MRKINPSRQADEFLRRMPPKYGRRLAAEIRQLAADPQPPDSKPFKGAPSWRADSGEYRIIYAFDETTLYLHVVGKRNAQERLEGLLLEGINSGAAKPTADEDWDRIRVEGQRRAGVAPQEA